MSPWWPPQLQHLFMWFFCLLFCGLPLCMSISLTLETGKQGKMGDIMPNWEPHATSPYYLQVLSSEKEQTSSWLFHYQKKCVNRNTCYRPLYHFTFTKDPSFIYQFLTHSQYAVLYFYVLLFLNFFFAISTSPSFIFNSSTIGLRLTCSSFFLNLRIILHSSHNFSHTALLLSSELFSFNPLLLFWLAAKPRSFLLFTLFLSHYRLDSSHISPYCLLHQLIYPNQPNPTKRSTKNCEK